MGCQQSRIGHMNTIFFSVIDPAFLKPSNELLRKKFEAQGIHIKTYMSVDCFIQDQQTSYSNNVVVPEQHLQTLLDSLDEIKSSPNVYVLLKMKNQEESAKNSQKKLIYISSYEEILKQMEQKLPTILSLPSRQRQLVDIKLLKDFRGEDQPQLFIFQETLKIKKITYKIYNQFAEFVEEMNHVDSKVIVTDYIFQEEVVELLRKKKKKAKIICYCNFDDSESYHPSVYFITNNFQQIANEVSILKSFKLPPLQTSKVFLCSKNAKFFRYKSTLQRFDLNVREFTKVKHVLFVTKYYFSLIIMCPQDQKQEIQKQLAQQGMLFRVKVLGIMEQTENSPHGLRKIIRQVKRGYLIQKGVCKMVDIIDKYHNNSKFQDIKSQLTKNQINFRCFDDFNAYKKSLIYCSSYIICNFNERHFLAKFLEQVQSRSKVIIFCNKSKIGEELPLEKKWTFISSHFGKIIHYIKIHPIMIPVILDHNQQRIQLKQQKLKNKQHRISALKWSDPNVNLAQMLNDNKKQKSNMPPELSFIVPKSNINMLGMKQILHDASSLLKLTYNPVDKLAHFKTELTASLTYLRDKYKLSYPQAIFSQLLKEIQAKSLYCLSRRVRQFFGSEKQMGMKINDSLKRIETLDQKELKSLREIMFLTNLNFINYYEMPKIGSVRLIHWTKETLLESCLNDGVIIFKNFLVMYEEGSIEAIPQCVKLQLELQYSTLNDPDSALNPYFVYQGRYIFAPYTQFKLKGKIKENQSIACLELVKQPDFLSYYCDENLASNLTEYFQKQVQIDSSLIVDKEIKERVSRNLERCAILKLWRTCEFEKAAHKQKQFLKKEEQTENIDQKYLNELLYQLAHYQFKAGLADQFIESMRQITNNDASSFLKKECSALLEKLTVQMERSESGQARYNGKQNKQRTQKCIELRETIQKEQAKDEDGEQFESLTKDELHLFNHEQCLQVDDVQGAFEDFR